MEGVFSKNDKTLQVILNFCVNTIVAITL